MAYSAPVVQLKSELSSETNNSTEKTRLGHEDSEWDSKIREKEGEKRDLEERSRFFSPNVLFGASPEVAVSRSVVTNAGCTYPASLTVSILLTVVSRLFTTGLTRGKPRKRG